MPLSSTWSKKGQQLKSNPISTLIVKIDRFNAI
jgi:hypothetical protein